MVPLPVHGVTGPAEAGGVDGSWQRRQPGMAWLVGLVQGAGSPLLHILQLVLLR